jgi:Co/Zn/Cd efflux system component
MFGKSLLRRGKMSASCCNSACAPQTTLSPGYRKALWIALIVNVIMFAIEIGGGLKSGSVSLFADAVDFAGDAANYGISLAVLSMGLAWKSRAALMKGASMVAFGLFILGKTGWAAFCGLPPEPSIMGAIAVLALIANGGVALMLYAFRKGDANMRSVWLCSRNDAIGNIAVMAAAAGVLGTGTAWPDLAVALLMGGLALFSGISVIGHARLELLEEAV